MFAGIGAERPDGVANVRPDCLDADAELSRDLLVAEASPESPEDLALALAEHDIRGRLESGHRPAQTVGRVCAVMFG